MQMTTTASLTIRNQQCFLAHIHTHIDTYLHTHTYTKPIQPSPYSRLPSSFFFSQHCVPFYFQAFFAIFVQAFFRLACVSPRHPRLITAFGHWLSTRFKCTPVKFARPGRKSEERFKGNNRKVEKIGVYRNRI